MTDEMFLEDVLQDMVEMGLVERVQGGRYKVTAEGHMLARLPNHEQHMRLRELIKIFKEKNARLN